MEATAPHNAARLGRSAVYAPGLVGKGLMVFVAAMIGGLALMMLALAVGALGRGGDMAVMAIFFLAIGGGHLLLLRYLWPYIDAAFRLRIEIGAGQASFRLPARRKPPAQPAYAFALPLQQIEKLATRVELSRSLGQIVQMRQFAFQANGLWIEYGGVLENSLNGMISATGKVALASVAALQHATGLQVEDHGVVLAARKGEAGAPWGGVSLAAPAAAAALEKAGKNASMWRNVLIAMALVVVAVRAIQFFVR